MKYDIGMLINCPRCGFSQPQDEYCASCGVNIEKYIPQKSNGLVKIFSSTMTQVFLVVIATLGVSYFGLKAKDSVNIPQSSRHKIIQQTTYSASSAAAVRRLDEPARISSGDSTLEDSNNHPRVTVELPNEEMKNRLTGGSPVPNNRAANLKQKNITTSSATSTAATVAAASPAVSIKVSYYEVNRSILKYWIQNSAPASGEGAAFSAGVISRELLDAQLTYAPLKDESTKAALNVKTNFKSTANKDGLMIGLDAEINMSSPNTGSITITKTTIQGRDRVRAFMNMTPDNVFFIFWKNDLVGFENEPVLSEVAPFQIFKSKQYLMSNGTTELVMIIEMAN